MTHPMLRNRSRLVRLVCLILAALGMSAVAQTRAPARRGINPSVKQDTTAIEGVQSASLDQPRIYVDFARTAGGKLLSTAGNEPHSGVEAFLDTGASGIVLSSDTAQRLGIAAEANATYEDVGVGGSESFNVSEPLFVATAPYPKSDPDDPGEYSHASGPFRTQVRRSGAGGLLEMLAPGMDVLGMPALAGKVIVLDPTPLAKYDKIRTSLVLPNDPSIPRVSRHIPLTLVSFARFTRVTPAGAAGPQLASNPMIGPDPLIRSATQPSAIAPAPARRTDSRIRPVVIIHNGRRTAGTFLLDTGSATSMISSKLAGELGIKLAQDGTIPDLPKEQQFTLMVGGMGGGKTSPGLFFDQLELPTLEGQPIVYTKAPLLISDITVADEHGGTFTLDGVFGMNYLVASAMVSGGLLPDIDKIVDGPYKSIIIDLKQNVLGLEMK